MECGTELTDHSLHTLGTDSVAAFLLKITELGNGHYQQIVLGCGTRRQPQSKSKNGNTSR